MNDAVRIEITGYPAGCLLCKLLVRLGIAISEREALLRGGLIHALPAASAGKTPLPLCEAEARS